MTSIIMALYFTRPAALEPESKWEDCCQWNEWWEWENLKSPNQSFTEIQMGNPESPYQSLCSQCSPTPCTPPLATWHDPRPFDTALGTMFVWEIKSMFLCVTLVDECWEILGSILWLKSSPFPILFNEFSSTCGQLIQEKLTTCKYRGMCYKINLHAVTAF